MAANGTTTKCPGPMKATSQGAFQGENPLDYALPLAIVQICLVVVVTRGLAYLLRPLRQPRVIAEIIVSTRSLARSFYCILATSMLACCTTTSVHPIPRSPPPASGARWRARLIDYLLACLAGSLIRILILRRIIRGTVATSMHASSKCVRRPR
jgi:hypothetical protein